VGLRHLGKDHLGEAKRLFEAAIDLDPANSLALSGLALACSWEAVWGWADDPAASRAMADHMAERALAADANDAFAHTANGIVQMHRRQLDASANAHRRALDLNPNLALAEGMLANTNGWMGHYDEAILHADRAMRLSPRDPAKAWWSIALIVAAFVTERYEEQVERAQLMTQAIPDHPAGWRLLAIGLACLDRIDEAREAVQRLLRVVPHDRIELMRKGQAGASPDNLERMVEAMRKAGLPE
jgi:tetratricopeptide (TPR) repeat protein